MKVSKSLRAIAVLALGTVALQGQGAPPTRPPNQPAEGEAYKMILHTVRPGKIYYVEGGGGTAAFVVARDGVIVIDSKRDLESGRALLDTIASVTPKPVTYLIETHSDCDHINGVVAFPKTVHVIAHRNNFIEQEQVQVYGTIESQGVGSGMPPADRFPDMLISEDTVDTHLSGEHVIFKYFGPFHTSGDLISYFPDEKVVDAGDLFADAPLRNGKVPQDHGQLWKFEKGGSIAGWFKAAHAALALDADIYIPGHGSNPIDKARAQQLVADMQADKDKIDALADSGKSEDEIETAMGDKNFPVRKPYAWDAPIRSCPRGMAFKTYTWMEYHEWLVRHNAYKPN